MAPAAAVRLLCCGVSAQLLGAVTRSGERGSLGAGVGLELGEAADVAGDGEQVVRGVERRVCESSSHGPSLYAWPPREQRGTGP
jgi:hypothetical protein